MNPVQIDGERLTLDDLYSIALQGAHSRSSQPRRTSAWTLPGR